MMNLILRVAPIAVCLAGCAPSADVEISAPDVALDTINPTIGVLAGNLATYPSAQTLRLSWRVVPRPHRPREVLPREFVYNRAQKTLKFHHEAPFVEVYSGVSDPILKRIAAKKGGVRMLIKSGCPRTFEAEWRCFVDEAAQFNIDGGISANGAIAASNRSPSARIIP